MLKILYPVCCGMDVHKKIVVAIIASTSDKNITTYQTKQFNTHSKDLHQLKEWLSEHNCKEICMESTGKYWIPIYNIILKNEAFDNSIYEEYFKKENTSIHINPNIDKIILFLQAQGFEVTKANQEISPFLFQVNSRGS